MERLLPVKRIFGCSLLFFHASEFAFACAYHEAVISSLLFSKPYVAAMAFACLEHALELRYVPGLKASPLAPALQRLGLAMILAGEGVRKAALLTAGRSFSHSIAVRRKAGHRLVTWGVYSLVRHPGYLGWALWALGTQVLLQNAVSLALFAAASWSFFSQRIAFEEARLREIFPGEYEAYRARTPTLFPGIP